MFVLRGDKAAQMSSVCVIDPEEPKESVVEIMLSTERPYGLAAADLAGTALFIEGNTRLAEDVRARIQFLMRQEVAILCHSEEEIREVLGRSQYYFAYGSNMSAEQMGLRVPHGEHTGIGVLKDYRIGFTRRGSYRSGGVASVVPALGSRVYGVVWRVTAPELEMLDEEEDPSAYRRRPATISLLDGKRIPVHVYEAIPEGGVFPPDRGYLDLIIAAAESADLPTEYIDKLRDFHERGTD